MTMTYLRKVYVGWLLLLYDIVAQVLESDCPGSNLSSTISQLCDFEQVT